MNDLMDYELFVARTEADWRDYHRLRCAELFAARGIYSYDPDNAGHENEENIAFMLRVRRDLIAIARFDLIAPQTAALRTVAVSRGTQGSGHGTVLINLIEEFARGRGVSRLVVNAHPAATGFWRKCGFKPEKWDVPIRPVAAKKSSTTPLQVLEKIRARIIRAVASREVCQIIRPHDIQMVKILEIY